MRLWVMSLPYSCGLKMSPSKWCLSFTFSSKLFNKNFQNYLTHYLNLYILNWVSYSWNNLTQCKILFKLLSYSLTGRIRFIILILYVFIVFCFGLQVKVLLWLKSSGNSCNQTVFRHTAMLLLYSFEPIHLLYCILEA